MRHPNHRLICKLFFVPDTGYYGFSWEFEGEKPHHVLDTCRTRENVLAACDPHHELVWEAPQDGSDPNVLAVSYGYRVGTVGWVMDAPTLAEISQRRLLNQAAAPSVPGAARLGA